MESNNLPLLHPAQSDNNPADGQSFNANISATTDELENKGLSKIALGVLAGATLGGVAGALANRGTADRINQTIRDIGNAIKRAAANVNHDIHNVGEAVHSVSTGVNDTVNDVGNAVRGAAEDINSTVKDTVNTVKSTANNANATVQDTFNSVKDAAQDDESSKEVVVSPSGNGTLYKLIPVNPDDTNSDPS